ncbi:hypothetical protein NT6N_17270 [Oceaniferula spumae]|uniref:Porin n=1 Tax=Oceaniferula spumae TaxID=2979115 RepID=A0AAT9FL62_9BACT
MTTQLKLTTAAALATFGAAFPALAGPPAPVSVTPPSSNGDWCTSLQDFGKFYSNKDAAFIQEMKIFGRFQAQYAHIDGQGNDGDDFSEGFDTIRRFRLGTEIKFLNNFSLLGRANLVGDARHSGGERDFAYQDWDELKLSYTLENFAGLDALTASYGRHKISMGHESHTSSKKIKTVERSAISNKIYANRYTGLTLTAERGDWSGTFGLLSLDSTSGIGNWDHGTALYLSSAHKVGSGNLVFDLFYNLDADNSGDDEVGVGYEWAASVSYERQIANWNLMVNGIYGDNGDTDYVSKSRSGSFWGVVIMPSTYIIEDKLEFVARYAYQGSSENEGIRTNSRYFRADNDGAVNSGRGDSHHSIYAGLNYFLCGHNSKIMVGVEYETLDTPNVGNEDADATTLWAAYRMYF